VEVCDFRLMNAWGTEDLLRAVLPDRWERYLESATSRRMLEELGVNRRYLTHLPGSRPQPGRATALDLARSAVDRMMSRHPRLASGLDALIFVSTSNPNPCNSQAAMLAGERGLRASCLDLKAGCSGGVLGLMQGAMLINSGCERVLVVMAETLSQFTPPDDLRMLVTVGDGAACVLLERGSGPGFKVMLHGSAPEFAHTMSIREPFPPTRPGAEYVYRFQDSRTAATILSGKWRTLWRESLDEAGIGRDELAHWFFHQTHSAQVNALLRETGIDGRIAPRVIESYGNMGTPTFAVALSSAFTRLKPGDPYLLQAVGGGISWCAIVAEHE